MIFSANKKRVKTKHSISENKSVFFLNFQKFRVSQSSIIALNIQTHYIIKDR